MSWILSGMESPLETVSPQLLDSLLHDCYLLNIHVILQHCNREILQVFIHPETPQDCWCCLGLPLQPSGRVVLVLGKVKFLPTFMLPLCKLQAGWNRCQTMYFHWSQHSFPLLFQYCSFSSERMRSEEHCQPWADVLLISEAEALNEAALLIP